MFIPTKMWRGEISAHQPKKLDITRPACESGAFRQWPGSAVAARHIVYYPANTALCIGIVLRNRERPENDGDCNNLTYDVDTRDVAKSFIFMATYSEPSVVQTRHTHIHTSMHVYAAPFASTTPTFSHNRRRALAIIGTKSIKSINWRHACIYGHHMNRSGVNGVIRGFQTATTERMQALYAIRCRCIVRELTTDVAINAFRYPLSTSSTSSSMRR